jgi:lipopolysaccharide/colanic/teichoic acid biosynthesis glycosyltransferase
MLKRLLDMIVSASALLLLSPILLIICLILRFSGEGEVFFGQERIGYKGKPFRITKFATMVKSAAVIAQGDYTVQNDPRVLPVGRFLRKSKINELMQLWDVLRGEMSLVGPRPQIPTTQAYYPPFYQDVLVHVRPGITGVGSLAFRDEEAILTPLQSRARELVCSQPLAAHRCRAHRLNRLVCRLTTVDGAFEATSGVIAP